MTHAQLYSEASGRKEFYEEVTKKNLPTIDETKEVNIGQIKQSKFDWKHHPVTRSLIDELIAEEKKKISQAIEIACRKTDEIETMVRLLIEVHQTREVISKISRET